MTRMSKKLRFTLIVVAALTIAGIGLVPAIIRARTTPAMNACVNNLRQLDGVKELWVAENHKTTNDAPTWDDLVPYLRHKPVCPQGGTYILGRAGQPPRCSVGGTHSIPE